MLALSKLKADADEKSKAAQSISSVFHKVDNIMAKGENAGYKHVLHCPDCFQRSSSKGLFGC